MQHILLGGISSCGELSIPLMESLKPFTFSSLIAFFLPGVVALSGMGRFFPTLGFEATLQHPNTSVTSAAILFVVSALALGLSISSIRSLIVDSVFVRIENAPKLDYSCLTTKDRMEVYLSIIDGTYRFFQFSANMGLSLLVLAAGRKEWAFGKDAEFSKSQAAIVITAFVLLLASYFQYAGTMTRLRQVLQGMSGTRTP